MASGDRRQGKQLAAVEEEDKFPVGMRVLAVDDDPVYLRVLEEQLRICKYNPTIVTDARTALEMLREGGEEQFDLVITDIYMPDMDGFKLLELIRLDMDLPVIMLSVNGEKETAQKGIKHGACDYLVKPVSIKKLKNIWRHVVRKNLDTVNHISCDNDDADQRVQLGIAECAHGGKKSKKCSKKKKNDGEGSDENKETAGVATRKKQRVSWTGELHDRFLEVINQLGVDSAAPKKILAMMNVPHLSRESVSSHLQKYRRCLKRITESKPLGEEHEKRSSCHNNMKHQGSSSHYCEHPRGQRLPAIAIWGSNVLSATPSFLGPHGLSIQPRNSPANSFANKSYHTMLDTFPSADSSIPYINIPYVKLLHEKLLEASNVVPSSPLANSFTRSPNGGMLEPIKNPLQPPELASQFSCPMNVAPSVEGMHGDSHIPCLVGNSSNPWKNVVSSSFPNHIDRTSLVQSSQVVGIINNNSSITGFIENIASFNIASNTTPIEMTSDHCSLVTPMVNVGSISSPLLNLQVDNYVVPSQMLNAGSICSSSHGFASAYVMSTQMLNGNDAYGIVPMQEGPGDQ